ncbi:aromatic ring-opening dioxygenase LigA [Agromyces sp. LHK192]|uniref:aromatic ring-opening dioxygenase LigA n=1 Tax=Agromyces sp. LHK192 TaxID=2498704 RepID=UPI000FDAAAD4|nr:aromatic ring-opening dioxygenase LigA [Agromyces sp. LHK192]
MTEQFETGGSTLSRGQVNFVRLTGLAAIIGGILMVVVAIIAWTAVTTQLSAENITIPDDAACCAGQQVNGPIGAYVQADIINHHALEAADGKTYAELEQDDPVRATVADASFLRASLFTSVVAYGVALMAAGVGLLFVLIGWALRIVVRPIPKD